MIRTFLQVAVNIYRANPFRPHCTTGKHVWLCSITSPLVRSGRQDCPEKGD